MTKPDLAALSEAATPGMWDIDTLTSEGSYGSGDDTYEGFATTAIYDASGKVLFDALNSDAILVHEEWDEDGGSAYDLTSAANAAFIVALVNAYRTGDLVLIDREGMREKISEQLREAYTEGATNVHDAWIADLGQREADFGEAAHDYAGDTADAAIAAILGEGK